MRTFISIILLFSFLVIDAQTLNRRRNVISSCDDYSALWYAENNTDDESGSHDLTGHSVYYGTTSPPQGTYCWDLNGLGRYLDGSAFDLGDEISWVFHLWHGSGSGIKTIWSNLNGSNNGYWLYVIPDDDDFTFYANNGSNNPGSALNCSIPEEAWYCLVVTLKRSTGALKIYLNGSDVTTDGAIATDCGNNYAYEIGGRNGGDYYYGYMDAVAIYPFLMTAAQALTESSNEGTKHCE